MSKFPDNWNTKTLVECTKNKQISYGIVQPGRPVENGVPIIRVNNFNGGEINSKDLLRVDEEISKKHKKTLLKGGEVLLTIVGTTGQTAIVPKTFSGFNVARAVAVIDPVEDVGPVWIDIFLQSDQAKHFLDVRANTTVQKTLNLKDVRELPVPLPPKSVKEKIEVIYLSINNKIKVNIRLNETLEGIAQAIFKSWFVDFDPVHAKKLVLEKGLTPKQAERAAMAVISAVCSPEIFSENFEEMDKKLEEKLSSMPKDKVKELEKTAALFSCEFEESELGKIPKGWTYKTISDVTDLIIDHRGKTPKKMGGDWAASGYPAISAKNIKKGKLVRRDMIRFLDDEIYRKWMKEEIKRGDIVMTSEAPMGELFYVADDTKYCLSQRLYAMRANKNIIPSSFLYYYLSSGAAMSEMEGRSTGTTVVGIKQSELRKVKVLVPTTDISKCYDEIVENILQIKNENESQVITLGDIRDTLLPKLLAGEINLDKIKIDEVVDV